MQNGERRADERRLAGGRQVLAALRQADGALCVRDLVRAAACRGVERETVDRWLTRAERGDVISFAEEPGRPRSSATRIVVLTRWGAELAREDRRLTDRRLSTQRVL
jgi:hypothetical protein